jgi:hypothetical protein
MQLILYKREVILVIKYHATNSNRDVEIKFLLHFFLALAIDGYEWSYPGSRQFSLGAYSIGDSVGLM